VPRERETVATVHQATTLAVLEDVTSPQRTIITVEGVAHETVATIHQACTMAVLEDVTSPQRTSDTDISVACERGTITTRAKNAHKTIKLASIDSIAHPGEATTTVARHTISNGLVNVDAAYPAAPEMPADSHQNKKK